jgi:hypothetical protein
VMLFTCPHCQRSLSVAKSTTGMTLPCPMCYRPVTVPAAPLASAVTTPNPPTPFASPFLGFSRNPDTTPDPFPHQPDQPHVGPTWIKMFSATLAGAFLAGLFLLFGARLFLHGPIIDTPNKSHTPNTVGK